MNSATRLMSRFLGGINLRRPLEVAVDSRLLSDVFPNGIPAFTAIGDYHFSFKQSGPKILTFIRRANPA